MDLKTITKEQLNQFTASQSNSQLLQSADWSEFQKIAGHQVWRFGLFKENKLIASTSIVSNKLPLAKSYLYCPRGPVFDDQLTDEQKIEALKLILKPAT